LTHHVPEQVAKGENANLKFHFVTDGVESAVAQAKQAAGSKNVTVIGGASTVQQLIKAGLLDELQIDIAPVLIGEGTKLFEPLGIEPIMLKKIRTIEYGGVTRLEFRVLKQ
jgi:dihydrofolate reductase